MLPIFHSGNTNARTDQLTQITLQFINYREVVQKGGAYWLVHDSPDVATWSFESGNYHTDTEQLTTLAFDRFNYSASSFKNAVRTWVIQSPCLHEIELPVGTTIYIADMYELTLAYRERYGLYNRPDNKSLVEYTIDYEKQPVDRWVYKHFYSFKRLNTYRTIPRGY